MALCLAACASSTPHDELAGDVQDDDSKADAASDVSTFYSVRAARSTPGFLVRRINSLTTGCPGVLELQESCLVATLDATRAGLAPERWTALQELMIGTADGSTEPEGTQLALMRADLVQGPDGLPVLDITEAWEALTPNATSGVFVRLRDMVTVCPQPPCESIRERKLNSALAARIGQIDFGPSDAVREQVDLATAALTSPDGLIIAGDRFTIQTPAQTVRARTATNAYMRIPPVPPAE